MSEQTNSEQQGNQYAASGVNFAELDPFKKACSQAAAYTEANISIPGINFVPSSRGESAQLIEIGDLHYVVLVEEGLGTKNKVADAMELAIPANPNLAELRDNRYYRNIGIDTISAMANDVATAGAQALMVNPHFAVGDSGWFKDNPQKALDFIDGFKTGCDRTGCVWGGGETPTLKGIVMPTTCALSGSMMGIISPKSRRIKGNIQHGDSMIFCGSSGIHINTLTLCRMLAERLEHGYFTKLPSGQYFGDALLTPSHIYIGFIQALLDAHVDIHAAVNISGHGFLKLMRSDEALTYVVEKPIFRGPHNTDDMSPPIFKFLQEQLSMSDEEAFRTFNMGAGFAIFIPEVSVGTLDRVHRSYFSKQTGNPYFPIWTAGRVFKSSGQKEVAIPSLDITYPGSSYSAR